MSMIEDAGGAAGAELCGEAGVVGELADDDDVVVGSTPAPEVPAEERVVEPTPAGRICVVSEHAATTPSMQMLIEMAAAAGLLEVRNDPARRSSRRSIRRTVTLGCVARGSSPRRTDSLTPTKRRDWAVTGPPAAAVGLYALERSAKCRICGGSPQTRSQLLHSLWRP